MTSADGVYWTVRMGIADHSWRSVCWAPEISLFCAVASGSPSRVMTSPDGVVWTIQPHPLDRAWCSVCWAPEPSIFCAVASSGSGDRVMTSLPAMPNSRNMTRSFPGQFVIAPSQNVGIGTQLPLHRLHVASDAYLHSSVGVGTTLPRRALDISGSALLLSGNLGVGGVTPTACVTFPAGTSSLPPFLLTPGTLLASGGAGFLEYDGAMFYASRAVMRTPQVALPKDPYPLTSTTSPQQLMSIGSVAVPAGVFLFDCRYALSNLDATSASFGFGISAAGGAAISSQGWLASAVKTDSDSGNLLTLGHNTTTSTSLVTANTGSNCMARVQGVLRLSAGGILTPQVSVTAAQVAAFVRENAQFRIYQVGSVHNTNVALGDWS